MVEALRVDLRTSTGKEPRRLTGTTMSGRLPFQAYAHNGETRDNRLCRRVVPRAEP